MHLSMHNWMRAEPVEVTIRRLAKYGYESIEISGEPDLTDTAEVRRLLKENGLRCWGSEQYGMLGFGEPVGFVGDDETPASLGDVPVGEPVVDVVTNNLATCVRFADGDVRCVGDGFYGLHGGGTTDE